MSVKSAQVRVEENKLLPEQCMCPHGIITVTENNEWLFLSWHTHLTCYTNSHNLENNL